MPIYRAVGSVGGSKYLGEFEAATKEEAEAMAWDSEEASVSLCHQCSDECSDGEITEIFLEEVEPEPRPRSRKAKR